MPVATTTGVVAATSGQGTGPYPAVMIEEASLPEHTLYRDALKVVEDIQGKVQHYLGWLTRFLSNERMTVVAGKYLEMIQPLVTGQPQREFLAVAIEPVLAAHAAG